MSRARGARSTGAGCRRRGAEVDEVDADRRIEQTRGERRHDDLATVGRAHQARGVVDRWAEVVAVALVDLAGVHAHAHAEIDRLRPRLGAECQLRVDRGRHRVAGAGEHRAQAVTAGGEHMAVGREDRLAQDLVVADQRLTHLGGMRIPQLGRPDDVGEQERHRPGRQTLRTVPRHVGRLVFASPGMTGD